MIRTLDLSTRSQEMRLHMPIYIVFNLVQYLSVIDRTYQETNVKVDI